MSANVVDQELRDIGSALEVSMRQLGALLGTSKNTMSSWTNGRPVQGQLQAVVVRGVANELARCGSRSDLLVQWRRNLRNVADSDSKIAGLRALINPPRDPFTTSLLTMQDAPQRQWGVSIEGVVGERRVVVGQEEHVAHAWSRPRAHRRSRIVIPRGRSTSMGMALRVVLARLDLSMGEIGSLLSTARQALDRWLKGQPGQGLHDLVVRELAAELRIADEWTVLGWTRKVHRALDYKAPPFEMFSALIVRPPSREELARALTTLQQTPQIYIPIIGKRGVEAEAALGPEEQTRVSLGANGVGEQLAAHLREAQRVVAVKAEEAAERTRRAQARAKTAKRKHRAKRNSARAKT